MLTDAGRESGRKGIAVKEHAAARSGNVCPKQAGQRRYIKTVMWISGLLLAVVYLAAGCEPGSPVPDADSDGTVASALPDGPAADQIMRQMRQAYLEAERYGDKASLHLSYQLQGRYLEEPHPWEVRFLRDCGLQIDVYEARIRADKHQLACFVFDFASGNLDGQWLVTPRQETLPVGSLFRDKIANHYLTGQEDLPVNLHLPLARDAFFPPTAALLTGHLIPRWLVDGTARRLADDMLEGQACYQISVTHSQLQWILHIGQEDFLIRQIRYPVELLDKRLLEDPQVRELEVVARFRAATWQPDLVASDFALDIPEHAKQVSRFVPVPEPFPSSHVGKAAIDLGLRDSTDQPVDPSFRKGKVTLLCWTDQAEDEAGLIATLQSLADSLSPKQYYLARVTIVQGHLPGNQDVARHLKELAVNSPVPVLADYAFAAGRALGLSQYPALAVIDRQGVLQYARLLPDNSPMPQARELASLLMRVRSGDDVAGEMRREYESFLDLYQEGLEAARIHNGTTAHRDDGRLASPQTPALMNVSLCWTSDRFVQPGNLRYRPDSAAEPLTLLDGWRTVIQLDLSGNEQRRRELDLDDREAISIVRGGDRQKELGLVYSEMGRTARVLNEDLIPIRTVESCNDQQRIRDASLFDFDNDGQDELMISFTGSRGTEIRELTDDTVSRQISNQSLRSATVIHTSSGRKCLVFCDGDARLRYLESGAPQPVDVKCDLVAAIRVVARLDRQGQPVLCATGTDAQGQWTAVGLDDRLNQTWSVPVGSQRFETQIEPVAWGQLPGSRTGLWAIAAADGSIKLIGDDGKQVDEWRLGLPIFGLELVPQEQEFLMVISTEQTVRAWALQPRNSAVIPAAAAK
jgi:hypothetical protein